MPEAEFDLEDALTLGDEQEPGDAANGAGSSPTPAADGVGWAANWGRLLRVARQVAGYSLTDLTQRTGLSKGYLSKLESGAMGAANPSRATLAALARALPSFRPLALTLAPGLGAEDLAFEGIAAPPPPSVHGEGQPDLSRLQLGWKELEVLAALMVLESSALPLPLTATLIARSIQREVEAVRPALARLSRCGLICEVPPQTSGQRAEYRLIDGALRQVGAARVGDLMLLATALMSAGSGERSGARRAGMSIKTTNPQREQGRHADE